MVTCVDVLKAPESDLLHNINSVFFKSLNELALDICRKLLGAYSPSSVNSDEYNQNDRWNYESLQFHCTASFVRWASRYHVICLVCRPLSRHLSSAPADITSFVQLVGSLPRHSTGGPCRYQVIHLASRGCHHVIRLAGLPATTSFVQWIAKSRLSPNDSCSGSRLSPHQSSSGSRPSPHHSSSGSLPSPSFSRCVAALSHAAVSSHKKKTPEAPPLDDNQAC